MEGDDLGYRPATALLAADECLSDKLGLWLRMAQKAFTDVVNGDFHRFRVSQLDFLVLSLIAKHPGCRQSAIAQHLEIKSPNVVTAIDYLVQRGLVNKAADLVDRRAYNLALTEKGAVFVDQLDHRYREITHSFFPGPQGEYQQRAVAALLRLIARRPFIAEVPDPGALGLDRAALSSVERQGAD